MSIPPSFLASSIILLLYSMKPEITVFRLKLSRRWVMSYDQLVAQLDHLLGRLYVLVLIVHYQVPETVQETVNAVDTAVIPLGVQLRRSHEQLVHTQGIAAVIAYQIIRGNHISFGFTHLDTVLTGDHTLVEQLV